MPGAIAWGREIPPAQALLVEEPYMAPAKEQKKPKGKGSLRIRDPSEAWSEETHASSTHEEERKEEEDSSS